MAFPEKKDWFYLMSHPNKCWNDESNLQTFSQYRYTTTTCFFKMYLAKVNDDASYEEKIIDVIKGFSVPAGLSWHLTDEVYVPVNVDDEFHWVLVVLVLKERCIKVYDSMSSLRSNSRKMSSPIEKLTTMLPQFLQKNDFFYQKDRTDWSALECYQDSKRSCPFDVVNVAGIAQQASDSLDCGVFVAAYAEYLSDGLQVPSCGIVGRSLRERYASLLWNYGVKNSQNGDVSDNDDPRRERPKPNLIPPDEIVMVNID